MGTYCNAMAIDLSVEPNRETDIELNNSYGLYAWLGCKWRNYSKIEEFHGVVETGSKHSPDGWLERSIIFQVKLQDLLDFDYDQSFFDARHNVETTYREFLRQRTIDLFRDLHEQGFTHLQYYFD
jgi:hypothetical protein